MLLKNHDVSFFQKLKVSNIPQTFTSGNSLYFATKGSKFDTKIGNEHNLYQLHEYNGKFFGMTTEQEPKIAREGEANYLKLVHTLMSSPSTVYPNGTWIKIEELLQDLEDHNISFDNLLNGDYNADHLSETIAAYNLGVVLPLSIRFTKDGAAKQSCLGFYWNSLDYIYRNTEAEPAFENKIIKASLTGYPIGGKEYVTSAYLPYEVVEVAQTEEVEQTEESSEELPF